MLNIILSRYPVACYLLVMYLCLVLKQLVLCMYKVIPWVLSNRNNLMRTLHLHARTIAWKGYSLGIFFSIGNNL